MTHEWSNMNNSEPAGLPSAPRPILLPGEKIDLLSGAADRSTGVSDAALDEKYVAGEVRIVTEQARYPLNSVLSLLDSNDYELNPEFQRRHRWSAEKQSRLIESFIMNVPVPPIFLYEDSYSHYEVMDGLQRLTAIGSFYRNELELEGLSVWPELNGRRYANLPEQVRRGIDRRYLSSIILLRETARSPSEAQALKQLVFERINSGGVRLEPQEARNAIYDGPLNKLCIVLSRDVNLCRTWGIPEPDHQEIEFGVVSEELETNRYYSNMGDVELVLRFFAHRQRQRIGSGALRDYLDEYLRQGNLFPEETLAQLSDLFTATIRVVYETLGPEAFWLWRHRHGKWGWLERPTTTAYDAFMYVFSLHLDRSEELIEKRSIFKEMIPDFYEQHVGSFDARMTNMTNLRERDDLVYRLVQTVLAA